MARAEWGSNPEFFGPRHVHREDRLIDRLRSECAGSGLHLECAAGVGSLSMTIAWQGRAVVAADASLRSLAVLKSRISSNTAAVLPVVVDITALPFDDGLFDSVTSAETLEHIEDDRTAVAELARVLIPGGALVGTVPAGPEQWSDWDDWAGHLRRYTDDTMTNLLESAGLAPDVVTWGWPMLRLYDDFFLKRVNRRRLQYNGPAKSDPELRRVSSLGRRRWLVRLVSLVFGLDRLLDGNRRGVGLLFSGRKPRTEEPSRPGE